MVSVGDYKLTEKDVRQNAEIVALMYPDAPKDESALDNLIFKYISAEILRLNGHPIDETTLAKESARIDKDTQAPETLAKIKAVFGGDKKAYERVFVLPTYADRTIYFGFFLGNDRIQARPMRDLQEILAGAKANPKRLEELAKEHGKSVVKLEYSEKDGINTRGHKYKPTPMEMHTEPEQVRAAVAQAKAQALGAEAQYFRAQKAFGAAPGKVLAEPLARAEYWLVLRVAGKSGGKLLLDGVVIEKENFGSWMEGQKTRVKVVKY